MKKKLFTTVIAFAIITSLTACQAATNDNISTSSGTETEIEMDTQANENTQSEAPISEYSNDTLEDIITGIEADFEQTIQYLTTQLDETNQAAGTSYEDYIENKQLLANWYELVLAEETALFARTEERAIEYLKLISSSIDHEDDDAIDDAMDQYYDKIYDNIMDDFYDDVYDDLMDDVYDTYYDGIIEDGYDIDPYEKWSNESSECYKAWSETSSAVYKGWSNTSSTLYGYWSAVSSGFYNDNFDVDAIIAEYKNSQKEEAASIENDLETESANESTNTTSSSEGIRPEFQEAMDSYEAFFDEYVDFMNEYASADTDELLDMMDEYTDYMTQYVETMEKFSELESDDLSTEEALYYAEVSSRISAKLLEIEY